MFPSRCSVTTASLTLRCWQTPYFFNLAESYQHFFILFVDCCLFLLAEHLDHIPMRAVEHDKRVCAWTIRCFAYCRPYIFVRHVWSVIHDVRKVGGPHAVAFVWVPVSPEDR